jgi:hypothetical protein
MSSRNWEAAPCYLTVPSSRTSPPAAIYVQAIPGAGFFASSVCPTGGVHSRHTYANQSWHVHSSCRTPVASPIAALLARFPLRLGTQSAATARTLGLHKFAKFPGLAWPAYFAIYRTRDYKLAPTLSVNAQWRPRMMGRKGLYRQAQCCSRPAAACQMARHRARAAQKVSSFCLALP